MEVYRRIPPAGEAELGFGPLRAGNRYAGTLGEVATELEVLALTPGALEGVVRYAVADLRWEHWFRAARLDVQALDGDLAAAGLRRTGWLTSDETWFAAAPGQPTRPAGPGGARDREEWDEDHRSRRV